jgi:hypothetical protein
MTRSYNHNDDSNFEKFQKRPKNPKKGKNNRSNNKQIIRDHFDDGVGDIDDRSDRFMDRWEDRNRE